MCSRKEKSELKQEHNLFRPQVYFQKKDEIDALKADFEENGNGNKSAYFHDLIMLGLKAKNESNGQRNDEADLLHSVSRIESCLNDVQGRLLAMEDIASVKKTLSQNNANLCRLEEKLEDIRRKQSVHEKVLANIYRFTLPKLFYGSKALENGEYDALPERLKR